MLQATVTFQNFLRKVTAQKTFQSLFKQKQPKPAFDKIKNLKAKMNKAKQEKVTQIFHFFVNF